MCKTLLPVTPTQLCEGCTIFVNVIDCVVGAIVEQVYSSTFKFRRLKYTTFKKSVPEMLHFYPVWVHLNAFGGRAPHGPAGSWQRPHIPYSWIKEWGEWQRIEESGKRGQEGRECVREEEGRDNWEEGMKGPPMSLWSALTPKRRQRWIHRNFATLFDVRMWITSDDWLTDRQVDR